MNGTTTTSPFTGLATTCRPWNALHHIFEYTEEPYVWNVTHEVISEGFWLGKAYAFGQVRMSEEETLKSILLAKSKIWRGTKSKGKPILIISDAAYVLEEQENKLAGWGLKSQIATSAGLLSESVTLSFSDKALFTLENILREQLFSNGLCILPSNFSQPPSEELFKEAKSSFDHGIAYGCNAFEEYLVYGWLHEEGYIRVKGREEKFASVWITPKGYALLEQRISGGTKGGKRGFFVRKFDPKKDDFFNEALQAVEKITKCHIEPVWAAEHNDKIDDRILSQIRDANLLLVEVDASNFNVGFEAGYGLALRKPIVWIREVTGSEKPRPFDIITYNCLDYRLDNPGKFTDSLAARVSVGLDSRD